MKKKTRSIPDVLFRKSESELIQLLQESLSRVSQLEARNRELVRQLNKFKTTAARERQRASSLRGQLRAEQEKVQTLQKSLRIARKNNAVAKKKAEQVQIENKAIKEFNTDKIVIAGGVSRNSYIRKSFDELAMGRTTVAIAHRLSTLRNMDRIVVLKDGHIIEQGTHAQLLRKRGEYARLWKMQSGGFLQD